VTEKTSNNLTSPFADQRQRGFARLRFSDFVEEEFRQYYAHSSLFRARVFLVFSIACTLISLGMMLASRDFHPATWSFNILVILPVLVAALIASAKPRQHALYQLLLAASALLIGLWLTSVVTRASIAGMPYYFSALVAWIFVVWLFLGLPFRHAAVTAVVLSGLYVFGIFAWELEFNEAIFSTGTLACINVIAAFCCYQLERAVRHGFLEGKELSQLAERDGLTGLYNRRSYDQYLERIWRQSRREEDQLILMLIDIDHFKAFNDHYGHQAGDDALKEVANVISLSAQRPLDFAARFGGEEFALILYAPVGDYGRELPEQLRMSVRSLKIAHAKSLTDQYLTVSIGVALVMPGTKRSLAGCVQMADEALYLAKEKGRNQVRVKESSNAQIQTGRFRADTKMSA
jgi:diguanylate cyclase (GGDEF)-like protein